MTGFDSPSAIAALGDLLRTIPGIEDVNVGAPESLSTRTSCYLTFGDARTAPRATQRYRRELDLIVIAGYVVEGHEDDAEAMIGVVGDELLRRVLQNRVGTVTGTYQGNAITVTPMLNGTVESVDEPGPVQVSEYAIFAGQEARLRASVVCIYQSESIG